MEARSLAELVEYLAKFLKQAPDGVILLDCFEYLAVENGFKTAFSGFSMLADLTLARGGRLLLSLSPRSLAPEQMALMRKYTQEVKT